MLSFYKVDVKLQLVFAFPNLPGSQLLLSLLQGHWKTIQTWNHVLFVINDLKLFVVSQDMKQWSVLSMFIWLKNNFKCIAKSYQISKLVCTNISIIINCETLYSSKFKKSFTFIGEHLTNLWDETPKPLRNRHLSRTYSPWTSTGEHASFLSPKTCTFLSSDVCKGCWSFTWCFNLKIRSCGRCPLWNKTWIEHKNNIFSHWTWILIQWLRPNLEAGTPVCCCFLIVTSRLFLDLDF